MLRALAIVPMIAKVGLRCLSRTSDLMLLLLLCRRRVVDVCQEVANLEVVLISGMECDFPIQPSISNFRLCLTQGKTIF